MPPEVALLPEARKALHALIDSIEGPYLIQINGAVRRGDCLVEAQLSYWRTESGENGLSVAPVPYGRTWPLPGKRDEEEGQTALQATYSGTSFGGYRRTDDVAGTLTAHDARGSIQNLVVSGGDQDDDLADEVAPPKPKAGGG